MLRVNDPTATSPSGGRSLHLNKGYIVERQMVRVVITGSIRESQSHVMSVTDPELGRDG